MECLHMKKHNFAFDIIKLFAITTIVIHHSGLLQGVLVRGYIWVEFFFITSGYLLYSSFKKNSSSNTLQHLKKRILRVYPEYFASWFLIFLFMLIASGKFPYENIVQMILEIFMMQNIGLPFGGAINKPLWYLSVMMLADVIIFAMLKKMNRKLYRIVSVLIILFTTVTMISNSLGIEQWGYSYVIMYTPFWRGFADMLIGTLIYQLADSITIKNKVLLMVMEIIASISIVILLFLPGNFDYICFIFIILLAISITSSQSIFNRLGDNKIVAFLMKYEYSIYLNHSLIIMVSRKIFSIVSLPLVMEIFVYIAILLVCSCIFQETMTFALRKLKK